MRAALRPGLAAALAAAALAVAACGGRPAPSTVQGGHEQGRYKVGNPYEIAGVSYRPREDYTYAETGIASWYGPKFHGKRTANGETFDMNEVSAAHKTLPMPSVVRVTNLENGRALVVRVNDRGPFVSGRIIDLSRRAADLIGMRGRGTARVRVEILAGESRRLKELALAGRIERLPETVPSAPAVAALPAGAVASVAAVPAAPAASAVAVSPPVPHATFFVQAGAFTKRDLAERAASRLAPHSAARITEIRTGGRTFYRVRMGPLEDFASAEAVRRTAAAAGFPEALVVIDFPE